MKIIKIGALWCPACLIMHKIWPLLENEFPDIEITSLDLDMDSDEVEKYDVGKTLPVLILTENDKEIDRIIGEKKFEEIKNRILEVRSK